MYDLDTLERANAAVANGADARDVLPRAVSFDWPIGAVRTRDAADAARRLLSDLTLSAGLEQKAKSAGGPAALKLEPEQDADGDSRTPPPLTSLELWGG